ncbi:MAG: hypothetical protein N2376_01020 [Clostridia bacterium]|nr:hypothetical protein [Clostridia bacterium]
MALALANLKQEMYKQAHSQEMTLSMLLETMDPTPEGSRLDAFERLMKEAQILTKDIPDKNIFSSKVEAFYRTEENKVLFPEFIARTLVKAMTDFPLYKFLVAKRTPIDGNVYKAAYLDLSEASNKKAAEMKRVTEAADLPVAKLKLGQSAITLYKYGRAIEASYEALRRMSIDLFNIHVARIGVDAAENKIGEILDVIVDGDGNSNAAPKTKLTDLDSSATALTKAAWIKFLLKFYPYGCDTVVANEDGLIQILEVLYPKSEVASKLDELLAGGLQVSVKLPQNLISNITLLYSPNVDKIGGKEAIVGLNRGSTVEEIFEVGSTISEADKFIKNQTQILTVSENSGFRKIFKDTSRVLTIE